ncbi:aldo/keto reductase [Lipingzhangella sp. LS1_29]|uniref:Aldo/keto reductase n=1 Tax=Lipingzhangella rawalii TaxID=2055835 RepID=A0ABU2H7T4_9ACTN|nr:aldo/keto reductase [Lipingzhangella rawalii]MDS1271360.1 aldo/keto reductase [Lipingzhangella rawalii]
MTQQQRMVDLAGDVSAPAVGQGTWFMGEDHSQRAAEVRALQMGLDLGMTLIDTAEMYGEGGAEEVVGSAIAGRRDEVTLVSKVYPHNAGNPAAKRSCERSLQRLGTDYLDVYLLHWRGSVPLEETVEVLEELRHSGKIRRWGVSNLDVDEMRELWSVPGGVGCVTNQVLYHLGSRGIEYDLLPWCREHGVPVMAYAPLGHGGAAKRQVLENPTLVEIASGHGVSPAQVALAWTIRERDVLAIPKAVSEQHVRDNAAALRLRLTEAELAQLDAAFPPPQRRQPLDII